MEELFRSLPGVLDTEVGYTGGMNDNPTYENHPGHAEALAITYDDKQITYSDILDFFFRIHDPTTINQQGNDIGSSYRSAIFFQNNDELATAKEKIEQVDISRLYSNPVVTSLEKFIKFHPAEGYHQDYLQNYPGGYTCHFVRTDKNFKQM